jgi:hypothetical protein
MRAIPDVSGLRVERSSGFAPRAAQGKFMKLKTIGVALLLGAAMLPGPTLAQAAQAVPPGRQLTASDLEDLRAELRSSQKQLVAQTLKLTDAEATRFWPVYDRYAAEMKQIKNDQAQLIAEYANNYGKYDDKAASDFITRWLEVDVRTTALRARYVPLVGQVLPGIKTTTFFQIDRRVSMITELKIATLLPILQLQVGSGPQGTP